MAQQKWETQSGLPTPALMFEQAMEHLRQVQENFLMLAHLQQTEDGIKDKALANGWLACAELMRGVQHRITLMAQGKLQ